MYPLISVIVPNYNHEKYLSQRLDSIFNQTYPNFEVILLDDCSIDNSRIILSEYAKKDKVSHCVFNQNNSGNTFIQWNKGISLAKGDYIWIAESDDFCGETFLEKVIQPLLDNQDVILSYCQSNRVNEKGEVIGNWIEYTNGFQTSLFDDNFIINGKEFIEKFLVFRNVIPNASAVIFKKPKLSEIEYLNQESLRCNGDWIFYTQLIWSGSVAYNKDSENNFRYHSKSVIATSAKTEPRDVTLEIIIQMRKKIIAFFLLQTQDPTFNIVNQNKNLIKVLKYEKAIFLIGNKEKIKGGLILISVLDIFFKKYKFRKNITLKLKSLFN
jgi:glycosyltransferase involved in cell wall biosynthesis